VKVWWTRPTIKISLFTLFTSEIVEHWGFDWVGMMQQLAPSPLSA
jgi:hypothetical protein